MGAVALVGVSWNSYSAKHPSDTNLIRQRADAAALERILRPGDTLYSLGNPTPLVLTGRRNPSRYIDLGSGIIPWIIHHTPGGFAGWEAKIVATHPAVIVISDWNGPYERKMESRLSSTYNGRQVGAWRVFVRPDRAPPRADGQAGAA